MTCNKCSGLVIRAECDELRCLICGKRYFDEFHAYEVDEDRPRVLDVTRRPRQPRALAGCLLAMLWILPSLALAEVSTTLSWTANTESDLAGYKLYEGVQPGVYGASVVTLGLVTTNTITYPDPVAPITRYYAITAIDTSGNESGKSNEVSKTFAPVIVQPKPSVPVLRVDAMSDTSLIVSYDPVDDGVGGVAGIDIRYGTEGTSWGAMTSVFPCPSPCIIRALTPSTRYVVQAVAFRGTMTVNAVFGPLSPVVLFTIVPTTPIPPRGLTIVSQTADRVIIEGDGKTCKTVKTLWTGSTPATHRRVVTCVRP